MATETPPPAQPGNLSPQELLQLRDTLKRCSPETLEAACLFRKTRDPVYLHPVVAGVIERYVERDLRPKLKRADENLRLIEDLGLDSLSLMEIVVMAEDVLSISVTNEELVQLRTVGDICRFVTSKVATAA